MFWYWLFIFFLVIYNIDDIHRGFKRTKALEERTKELEEQIKSLKVRTVSLEEQIKSLTK